MPDRSLVSFAIVRVAVDGLFVRRMELFAVELAIVML